MENRERGEEENTRESRDLKAELKVKKNDFLWIQDVPGTDFWMRQYKYRTRRRT